eukprot:gene13676-26517_t
MCAFEKDPGWCAWVLQKTERAGPGAFNQQLVDYLQKCFAATQVALWKRFTEQELRNGVHRILQPGSMVRARRRIKFRTGEALETGDTADVESAAGPVVQASRDPRPTVE